tara:strand:+ start:777 stop:1130 length:354 start_codon:yes stop_codon:yes gene_type:complete
MGLGNNMSMGQARGKAKPVLVKRRKEVVVAKNYTELLSTARQAGPACALPNGSNKYYHDGSSTFPAVNDRMYSRRRANAAFYLPAGHYKVYHASNSKASRNVEMQAGGLVKGVTICP